MRITFFQRRPRASGNYSLEAIFSDLRQRLPGIESHVRIAPYLSNGGLRRLAIMIDAALHQSDVNHVTGDITFAALLLSRKRTVVTILDCIDVDARSGIAGWVYRKLWFHWPVHRCAVVTTISEASKRDIIRITGCQPEKVVVTGVAISPDFKRVDRPFNEASPRILQVGTAPNKNIERLAEALCGIPCSLVIVGQLSDSQQESLAKYGIIYNNHTRLSHGHLLEEYACADIIAFASTFEGFGMPILEGNAVGRPVITGNCTSMPEVAGDAACIVDPFCPLSIRSGFQKVISDRSYRDSLVANGFENVKRFNADSIAQRYLAVYQEIFGRLSRGRRLAKGTTNHERCSRA